MNTYTFTVKRTVVGSILIHADTMNEAIKDYRSAIKKADSCDDAALHLSTRFVEGHVAQNEYELIDLAE